jgi:hypothetical protein
MFSSVNAKRTFTIIALAFATFSLLCVADCMRETDQASVLTGAWRLCHGGHIAGEAYYNYDKMYETYWITALAFWICSHFGHSWSPVFVGNVSSGITFWATTITAVLVLARTRRTPSPWALVCYLSTPAIVINSVYTNPAIISAGFLLLAGALISTSQTLARRLLGSLCFFIAVGARGDAVLLAPLIVWLQLPSRNWTRRALSSSTTWSLAAAIAASTLLGRILYTGRPLYFDPGFLGPKVFVGYVVFGLGASGLLLMLFCAVLLNCAVRSRTSERGIFYCVGALALILPICYYTPQLWSPRYLITTALGVFLFAISRRGEALLNAKPVRSTIYPMRLSFGTLAIVLLFVGLRLSSLTQLRLTVSLPTVFPTADGLHPMGAYATFLTDLRNVKQREVDHNQLMWEAAKNATYVPAPDGIVHVLDTSMRAYLELGATLKGLQPRTERTKNNYDLHGPLYADSRTFMRLNSDQVDSSLFRLLSRPAKTVSPDYKGMAVLEFAPDGDPYWGVRTRVLDDLFMGNEYRLYSPSVLSRYRNMDVRPFAIVADKPFAVDLNGRKITADMDHRSGLFYLRGDTQQLATGSLTSNQSEHVTLAVQVLPAWMSVHSR